MLKREIMAGGFFGLFATAVGLSSLRYPLGSFTNMGPGFFPLILSGALLLVSAAIVIQGLGSIATIEATWGEFRGLICTTLAVVFFALALSQLGLNLTVFFTALISSLGAQSFKLHRAGIVALLLSLGCYLLFTELLGLRLAPWPGFIGG